MANGCCCCTVYPSIVCNAITLVVLWCLLFSAMCFVYSTPFAHHKSCGTMADGNQDLSCHAMLGTFDGLGFVLSIIASSATVHHATDRLAKLKRPPFYCLLSLFTISLAATVSALILGLVDACVTGRDDYFNYDSWQDDSRCQMPDIFLTAPRGILLLATLSTTIAIARAYARPSPLASSAATPAAVELTSTTAASSSADEAAPPQESKPKDDTTPRKAPRKPCAVICRLVLIAFATLALIIPLLIHYVLRPDCPCIESEWSRSYDTRYRFCRLPEDTRQTPTPLPEGATQDSYLTFASCDAFQNYLRGSSCPTSTYRWRYDRPEWGLVRAFGSEEMGMGEPVMAMAETAGAADSAGTARSSQASSSPSSTGSGGSGSGATPPSFSETNVQVDGVDEADIVKTDGSYIYTLTPTERYSQEATLNIVKAWPPEEATLLSSTRLSESGLYGISPRQMMLHNDRLLVIGSQWHDNIYTGREPSTEDTYWRRRWQRYESGMRTVRMLVFNIANRSAPLLIRVEEIEGYFVAARKVGSMVYAVSNAQPVFSDGSDANAAELLPLKRSLLGPTNIASATNDEFTPVEGGCEGVGYIPAVRARSLIVVASIDLSDATTQMRTTVVAGRGQNIYASSSSLYVASPTEWHSEAKTMVVRFSLDGARVTYSGMVNVNGYILNQWAMDEYDSGPPTQTTTFRIVTTTRPDWQTDTQSTSHLFTYAVETSSGVLSHRRLHPGGHGTTRLTSLGSLNDLAPGERVYAVRFMGTRLYVVTFREVDPLFVIDLTDNASPLLLGELKVPGYSDYLHPVNSSHLIGIGKDATLQGQIQGMKLALFDASNPQRPSESYSLTIGDRQTHSAALDDHKAFQYDRDRRLLTLPVRLYLANTCPTTYGGSNSWPQVVWQGAIVWRVGEARFELRGLIPHYEPSAARDYESMATVPSSASGLPMCPRYDLPNCAGGLSTSIARAIYMSGDVLYTISPRKVRSDNLTSMADGTRVAIAAGTTSAAAGLWEASLNGSLISEVALPHSMCGGGGDGPIGIPEPVPMEGRVAGGASTPPPATAAYTCHCACATSCELRERAQITAARAMMG